MFSLFKPIAWLFSPIKIKLGPPTTLRFNGVFTVRISGTGSPQDPIVVTPLEVGPARQLFAQYRAAMEERLQGCDVPEELYIDWWKPSWVYIFDLVVEQDVACKTIGLQHVDWQWISRQISASRGRVLSVVQVRDLRTQQVSTFYFDHTAFFAALAGDFGVKLSMACSNSLNRMFSHPGASGTGAGLSAMIAIHANTSADVTNQISYHLSASRANGWTLGNAHFLVDGWRNEFQINKGNVRSVLVFDLRPTLNRIADRAALESASLAAFKDVVQAANQGALAAATVDKLKTKGHNAEVESLLNDTRRSKREIVMAIDGTNPSTETMAWAVGELRSRGWTPKDRAYMAVLMMARTSGMECCGVLKGDTQEMLVNAGSKGGLVGKRLLIHESTDPDGTHRIFVKAA